MKALHPSCISNLLFNIPIYQRLFTWGEEQIKELLDDLLLEYLSSNSPADYYIGVLTVRQDVTSNRLDLVDGQQRFTVMMLMGCAMKELYSEWKSFLKNENALRLDFRARPRDREYLSSIIDNGSNAIQINETMNNGLNFIKKYLESFQTHCEKTSCGVILCNNQKSDKGFCQYVYEHLSFFLTYLPDDYNARLLNKHFESMNSTGRNLENHEILKVQLLKDVQPEEYGLCVELWNYASRMEQTICSLSDPNEKSQHISMVGGARSDQLPILQKENENPFTSQSGKSLTIKDLLKVNIGTIIKEKESRNKNLLSFRPFINFTDYLLQILYLMLGDESKKNIVYQHFFNPSNLIITSKKYIGKEEGKISPTKFIKEVYRYRFFFDYYILRIDGNGSYRLLSAEASEHDKLEQYEAMLYADSSRYTYYRWIPFILEYVSNGANSLDNEQLLSELKVHDSLIDEHCETNFENFSFGNFNNYYFRRLDYYLWEFFIDTKKDGELSAVIPDNCVIDDVAIKAIKDYKFHQYNSVEHFHPQSEKEQSIKWDDETSIHSFGNLALISNTFNSTQNDNSLEMKFARIEEQINQNKIESIKLVLMYYSAQQKATNWTKELMEKHKELMVKFLENSYKI